MAYLSEKVIKRLLSPAFLLKCGFFALFVVISLISIKPHEAAAKACTSAQSGDWTTSTTWTSTNSCNVAGGPVAGDTITIAAGHSITVSTTVNAASISISANTANTTSINITTGTLNLSSTLSCTAPSTNSITTSITIGSGTLSVGGLITLNAAATSRKCSMTMTTGTLTASAGITFSTNSPVLNTGTGGTFNFTGTMSTNCSCTLNGGTTTKFTGTTTLNGAYTFGVVQVNSGTTSIGNVATTFSGTTLVASGATLAASSGTNTATKTFTGKVTVNSTGTFDLSAGSAVVTRFGGGIQNDSSNVFKTGAGAATLSATQTLSGSGSITFGAGLTIGTAGQTYTNNNTGTVTVTGAMTYTGNWVQGANSSLTMGSSNSGSGTLNASTNTPNTVTYSGTATIKAPTVSYYNVVSTGTVTGIACTITNNLTVSAGTLTLSNTTATTVSGTTTVSGGTLNITGSTSAKKFTGLVTVSSGTLSGSSTTIQIEGGITQSSTGTVNITGTTTFQTTAAQALNGTISLAATTISTGVTLTNNGTTTVTGTLTLTGNWTQGANSTLSLSTASPFSGAGTFDASTNSGNTVTYTGASPTCKVVSYKNLTFNNSSGASTISCSVTTIGGNLTVNNSGTSQAWTLGTTIAVTGNLSIGSGATVTTGAFAFSVTGTSSIAGTLTNTSNTGAKTYTGLVTVTGTLNGASTNIVFQGGISNSGGTVSITGTSTFNTNSQALNGTLSIASITATGVTLTNNGALTVSTDLSGSGGITLGSSATLILGGTFGISTKDYSATGSTVQYNGTTQSITATTYGNLTIGGTSTYTMPSSAFTINGNLLITTGATVTKGSGLITFNGAANTKTITGNAINSDLGSISIGDGSVAKIVQLAGNTNFTDVTVTNGATFDIQSYTTVLTGDLVATGTVQGTGSITVGGGDVTGNGTVNLTGSGTFLLDGTGSFGGSTAWTFNNLTFGDGSGTATTTASGNGTINVTSILTVATSQTLDAGSKTWNIAGTNTASAWCDDSTGITCNTSWVSRKKITLNNSASTENLTNFPVLIQLTSSNIDYSKTQNSGQDIRFVDPSDNTTVLDHEIETWNESGTSYVWVRVPQIDLGSTTDYIWVYYNNASASDGQNATGVWDSSFKLVSHLPDGTTLSGTDSTSTNTATINSATAATGKLGAGAADFNGTSGNISYGSAADIDNVSSKTISFWIKRNSVATTTDQTVISKRDATTGWDIEIRRDSDVTNGAKITYKHIWSGSSGTLAIWRGSSLLNSSSVWYHVVLTYNDSSTSNAPLIYVNGVAETITTAQAAIGTETDDASDNLRLSGQDSGIDYGNHKLDEVRLSNSIRSAEWIEAEYLFTNDGSKYSFGSEENQGSDILSISGTLTPNASTINFTSSSNSTIPANTYYNLGIKPGANAITHTLAAGTVTITNSLILGDGTHTDTTVDFNTNDPTISVTGDVTISSGTTLQASSASTLTVGGSFTNSGSFTHNSGTVTFNSVNTATVSGATTFNNFTSIIPGKTIQFSNGATFTFAGTMLITGASGNPIYIQSSSAGSQWYVTFNSTQSSISWISIKDSGCSNSQVVSSTQQNIIDQGNNDSCWSIIRRGGGGGGSDGGSGGSGSSSGGGGVSGGSGGSDSGSGGSGSSGGGGVVGGGGGASP